MAARPCPNCGRGFRSGSAVLIIVGRETKRQIVCRDCTRLAVPILLEGTQAATCDACGERRAKFCAGCVASMLKQQAAAERIS